MEDSNKVFSSNIIRNENPAASNLYELLNKEPAKPLPANESISDCNFWPKTDKHYVPKRKSRHKVKTVRIIRNIFEQDTYTYLLKDLEKQHNALLKRIRDGTSNEESTKTLAKKILYSEHPISRSAWEMLVHLNPEQHIYSKQCVLWSGRHIQVNGSRGGKYRFISNCDLSINLKVPTTTTEKKIPKKSNSNKARSLLKNSLNIKFKPGPLGRKEFLDDSHQKYHVGDIKLVDLPKLGLEIQPTYGMNLGSTISRFLDDLRDESGLISMKWAEFAVSVLGSVKKSRPLQTAKECITFNLNYKRDQHRMLMRQDHGNKCPAAKAKNKIDISPSNSLNNESTDVIISEVKCIIDEMIESVDISSQQNNFYCEEEVITQKIDDDISSTNANQHAKDKQKRKYCELERLAVTVIRVPENTPGDVNKSCNKSHCSLGCICDSLGYTCNIKQHCGRIECMFECKCDFSMYANMKSLGSECSEILPGLLNLNNEKHLKLSKEEQKFHQTVIMSGEKSILLKPRKRHCKSSRKYADFYNDVSLRPENKTSRTLSIVCFKLNCANIESWCMVHNLYKCFCKGKYTESSSPVIDSDIDIKNDIRPLLEGDKLSDLDNENSCHDAVTKPNTRQAQMSYVPVHDQNNSDSESEFEVEDNNDDYINTCARTNMYQGRKYDDEYYHNTNMKISDMEKNDSKLHKKLKSLMNENQKSTERPVPVKKIKPSATKDKVQGSAIKKLSKSSDLLKLIYLDNEVGLDALHKENKSKLVAWLENSYQQYKRQVDQGYVKNCLDPPRKGKLVLYTWALILSRYRERKNLFLVTKKKPYRVFIIIHNNHPLFKHCINIDDIKFDNLAEYPLTVKNLLTNATGLTDIFCILRGMSHCWELVGSVNKLLANKNIEPNHKEITHVDLSGNDSDCQISYDSTDSIESLSVPDILPKSTPVIDNVQSLEASKWFVMTLEDDFTEIQFNKRGFFVQYLSIVKAIKVARMTGKTVRLSSKKCVDKCNDPKFGIYAIPNANEDCVFVGPYEMDEPMGIETVKSTTMRQNTKRTRGVWITTNKVDNLKVIDNPLLFILPTQYSEMVPLETDRKSSTEKTLNNNMPSEQALMTGNIAISSDPKQNKMVKPIKIRKTNGFYHLASKGILEKLAKNIPTMNDSSNTKSLLINAAISELSNLKSSLVNNYSVSKSVSDNSVNFPGEFKNDTTLLTPTDKSGEIMPSGIKITAVYSTANLETPGTKVSEKGMSILKPEEINKKLFSSKRLDESITIEENSEESSTSMQDIENFLATSVIRTYPQDDVYIISDEEDYQSCKSMPMLPDWKEVFIRCTNIAGIGWITGKRYNNGLLSFQFPGFKNSVHYNDEEAFKKITQVLSRKIYVPKNINLMWEVVESRKLINPLNKLKEEDLGSDLILTKQGIRNKYDLTVSGRNVIKTYTRNRQQDTDSVFSVDASLSEDEEDSCSASGGH